MASKRTLNASNLEALGAPALAELLIEVSSGNAVIQRRLRLALAAAEGADGAAREVRKRLAAIARATTFIDSAKRKALLVDLEAQHQAITGAIAAADPALALELLVRFLELAEGLMQRSSDSTGALIGVFQRAADNLAPIAKAAATSPPALAQHGADLLHENGYGQFDRLIPSLAPVLGEEGLAFLANALLERGGVDRLLLEQIAQGRGDLDGYLQLFDDSQLSWPDTAAEVASHLLQAGRAEQALAVLNRAERVTAIMEAREWHDTRLAVLEALGRNEEAQQHRWQVFCQRLSIPLLRDYLKRLADFEDVVAEEQAFKVAAEHPLPLLTLQFLVGWPALPRAARYVIEQGQDWYGDAYEIYEPAAERLSADHPVAASLLLRAMVVFALSTGRTKRYRYAATHLRSCEQLAARIDDWQGVEPHTSFAGRLRELFALNWSFWKLVER
jgi:tetratricopeptide (TPR) repeat protein